MNADKQRIAITKWDGWETAGNYACSLSENVFYGQNKSKGIQWARCPDYLNDLNAIHKAVLKLDDLQAVEFCFALQKVVCGGYSMVTGPLVVNATAAQRCEALLKTLNLWTE
jgi:hypothetical protein